MVRIQVVWFGVRLEFVLQLGFGVGDYICHRVGVMIIGLDQTMME